MEFKPNNRNGERNRIKIPERGAPPSKNASPAPNAYFPPPAKPIGSKKDLEAERESLGFDDIPMDDESMEGVRFRDIFRAWAKQSVKNTPIEKRLETAKVKKQRLHDMKNDLKWAMQADLDEPVKPNPKVPKKPLHPKIAMHTNAKSEHVAAMPVSKSIDININIGSLPKIPKIKAPSKKVIYSHIRRALLNKKVLIIVGIILVLTAGYFGTMVIVKQHALSKNAGGNSGSDKIITTPDYGTFLPTGKDIGALGGWKRVSPPNGNPVFAYADKIDGTPISVSQQPLPDSFHPDVDEQVAELAKGFSATDKIDADGTKVYVGTSSKGPQSAILVKKDTLILIKSQAKISDSSWASYAKSLK
ncbi:MAG: hypothetical protein JWN75_768 [Candidatus Saccharibacteria bacterium]|nr:hypothetical protein [Candidatus Saccharibacteria bacterium]